MSGMSRGNFFGNEIQAPSTTESHPAGPHAANPHGGTATVPGRLNGWRTVVMVKRPDVFQPFARDALAHKVVT
jgi:hypothetical protein